MQVDFPSQRSIHIRNPFLGPNIGDLGPHLTLVAIRHGSSSFWPLRFSTSFSLQVGHCPWLDHTSSFGWALPLPRFLHCLVFLPALASSSLLGTNVTICDHLSHQAPLACEGTSSTNLGITRVMLTWIFVSLTGYCHIGSQRGKIPTYVRAGRPGSEGGVGEAGPSGMKMWSSLGLSHLKW